MRSICVLAVLWALCGLPVDGHAAQSPEVCTNKCANQRDACRLKACTSAGGHTQLHQGTCYNLPLKARQTYAASLTQCTAKLQACSNKCQ
jgi:hypothetical protein